MTKEDARLLQRQALELRLQVHQISPREFPLTAFSYGDRETGLVETVRIELAH